MRLLALAGVLVLGLAACSGPAGGQGSTRAAYRRVQRAYDGAPPVVPHPVRALGRQDCLSCHGEGLDLGGDGMAPRVPHPERVNCQQCHVEQVASNLLVRTSFSGLRHASRGHRAYPGAPPLLPHPRNGREHCLGCHGERGGSPLHTPHPDRVNCLQCHVEPVPGVQAWEPQP